MLASGGGHGGGDCDSPYGLRAAGGDTGTLPDYGHHGGDTTTTKPDHEYTTTTKPGHEYTTTTKPEHHDTTTTEKPPHETTTTQKVTTTTECVPQQTTTTKPGGGGTTTTQPNGGGHNDHMGQRARRRLGCSPSSVCLVLRAGAPAISITFGNRPDLNGQQGVADRSLHGHRRCSCSSGPARR